MGLILTCVLLYYLYTNTKCKSQEVKDVISHPLCKKDFSKVGITVRY